MKSEGSAWGVALKLASSIIALVAGFFAYRKRELEQKNTPKIKRNRIAQALIDERNQAEKLVGEVSNNNQEQNMRHQ